MHEGGYFDESVAATYDEDTADMFDPVVLDPAVDFLAELAGSGSALEFAIGTGRIAVPLAARGVPVHGIDLSNAMVARLHQKPGAEVIDVTIGDFATTSVDGSFSLVYLVFNTIGNLTTQEAQVACFRNAAAHLEPGGTFVVEVGIPELRRLPPRRDRPGLPHRRGSLGDRRVRRRDAGPDLPPLLDPGWPGRALLVSVPLRLARGARPDGPARRDDAPRAMGGVDEGAVHEREPLPRVGLGDPGSLDLLDRSDGRIRDTC
jgi:SAM-dependent methyltransferase